MDYSVFIASTLADIGFESENVFNCFQPPYEPERGWELKLPDVEFGARTVLMLHFQDFISTEDAFLELLKVEEKYKDRANRVIAVHMMRDLDSYYRGPVNLIEYSSHNVITVNNLQACRDQWIAEFGQPRDINWMSLNGRECNHRLRVAQILKDLPNGVLGYGVTYPLPGEWPYQTYRGTENHENFVRLANLYARAKINIVTETRYEKRPGLISEKFIMAAVAGQIPIVIGNPGIVKDCQEIGFDMFDDVVDISYDWAPNETRVEQALIRNQELIVNGIDFAQYQSRLDAQQRWALEMLENKYQTMFREQATKIADRLLP